MRLLPFLAVCNFIRSAAIGKYAPGTARTFDRAALLREFDKVRMSLVTEH